MSELTTEPCAFLVQSNDVDFMVRLYEWLSDQPKLKDGSTAIVRLFEVGDALAKIDGQQAELTRLRHLEALCRELEQVDATISAADADDDYDGSWEELLKSHQAAVARVIDAIRKEPTDA